MDAQTAYLLFYYKNFKPTEYYNAKLGERKILRAFMHQEIEDRIKESKSIRGEI
ncbi:hypothetical protein [Clostridium ihumii]|uniref:hypothetical protein n=1 Tax=Clostridium ihumii TaxID=1470356 RepID=UPI000AC1D378|nr:hypothetical protein [Clostridium ihumii]